MSEKKRATPKNALLHTIRAGSIRVDIREQRSNSGYCYPCMELKRVYVTGTNKESTSLSFFAENEQDILRGVAEGAAWIRAQRRADAQTNPQDATEA
jgi:hypothetical protein